MHIFGDEIATTMAELRDTREECMRKEQTGDLHIYMSEYRYQGRAPHPHPHPHLTHNLDHAGFISNFMMEINLGRALSDVVYCIAETG